MKRLPMLCASLVALAALALAADGASAASSVKSSKSNTSDRTAGSQGCPMDQGSATGGAGAGKSRIPQQGLYSASPVSAVNQQEKTASNTHPCGTGDAGKAGIKYEGTTNVENLNNSEKVKQPKQTATPAPK